MKVLVTGGAGFIGSHVVDNLLAIENEVVIVDNLSTGNKANINPKVNFYEVDIRSPELDHVFEVEKPHVVIHHAAQIDVQQSIRKPVSDADINISGTVNLLKSCVNHQVDKVIYASSAAVYGDPEYLPVDEGHPIDPISYYGISKHTPEHYVKVFSRLYGLKYSVLRYANAYGPRQDPKGEGGVISIFVDRVLRGESPYIYGDGMHTRDFIYVEDIARANLAALDKGDNQIINISCNTRTSINELFQMMNSIAGRDLQPVYKEPRAGDIVHSALDNTKAAKLLGWQPEFTLQEGLKNTIEYYRPFYLK